MAKIRLQQLEPGMIIAEDALTSQGKLVFPRGTRLGPESIQTLKAWGIPEVQVLDNEGSLAEKDPPDSTPGEGDWEFDDEVKTLYAKSNQDHPAIQELMRLTQKSRLQQKE